MIRPDNVLARALFGGPLYGDSAVYLLVVDEAGIGEPEPVAVVTGILLHADRHIVAAEIALREAMGAVPVEFRNDFSHFHATSLWNDKLYKGWLMSDRLALFRHVLSIPRKLGAAIASGIVVRKHVVTRTPGLSVEQSDHLAAFIHCVSKADKWLRENTHPAEVATMMVEQCGKMDTLLKAGFKGLASSGGVTLASKALLTVTDQEVSQGFVTQETEYRITRLRQSINFVEKTEDPLVQLADAAAFAIRRYYSQQPHGDTMITALLGHAPPLNDVINGPHTAYVWGPKLIPPFVVLA